MISFSVEELRWIQMEILRRSDWHHNQRFQCSNRKRKGQKKQINKKQLITFCFVFEKDMKGIKQQQNNGNK